MTSSRLNAKARAYMKTNPDVNYTEALEKVRGSGSAPRNNQPLVPSIDQFFFTKSVEDAIAHYPEFRLLIGESEDGTQVSTPHLARSPHTLVVGGTGTGKTVLAGGFVQQFRAAGFQVYVSSEKYDAEAFYEMPNVADVGTGQDAARVVDTVSGIFKERYEKVGALRGAEKLAALKSEVPIALVIDGAHISVMDTRREEIRLLATLGREHRIHLVITSFDVYAKTIDPSLRDAIGNVIMMTPVSRITAIKVLESGNLVDEVTSRTEIGHARLGFLKVWNMEGDGVSVQKFVPYAIPSPVLGPHARSEHGTELADMDALIENRVADITR